MQMRTVKFRKAIRTEDEFHVPLYITVTLETDELDPYTRMALNYLEDAIKALPGAVCEPALVERVWGLCEGCEGRKEGYVCPAKAYLETEVII